MHENEILNKIIYPAMSEVPGTEQLPKAKETPLFGSCGSLDSLALVNLILLVEEGIERETGKAVRLVTEKAMSQKQSPFLSVGSLLTYVDGLMKETNL